MPVSGRLLAVALTLVVASAAHAADPAQDPLTTPGSPLYQPGADVRAQVREVMGHTPRPQTAPPPAAAEPAPAALPELDPNNPVPRGLVAVAQRELAAQGYDAGPVDGRMGPKTRKALLAFQTDKGLPADGQLTFDLLAKLMVRVAPAVTAPPPPPPPPPPPVANWTVRRTLGKSVHASSGDLLGSVGDFVVSADNALAGVVVDTTNGYGTHQGKTVIPFAQVGHAITRAAIILPLSADKALPLRDKAQKMELAPGQWLLLGRLGDEGDAVADTDGKLVSLPAAK